MKISISLITALILITLCYSCTPMDDYDFLDTPPSGPSDRVIQSNISCPININFLPAQADRIRIELEPCDAPTDRTYELDAEALQYFYLEPGQTKVVARERLLTQEDIASMSTAGRIKVYDGERLIEERTIAVSALAIPSVPHEDIIACYPLDGDGTDRTGYANHATIEYATSETGSDQTANGAMKLDGEDGTIYAPHQEHLNLTKAFTLSAWVKLDERKTQTIVRKGATINGSESVPFALGFSKTGDIIFAMHDQESTRHEARKKGYPLCEWIHLAATYDNGDMKLYENGVLVRSADGPQEANTNDGPLLMGTRLRLPSDTMAGTLDNVRIYGRALTAQEVKDLSIQDLN